MATKQAAIKAALEAIAARTDGKITPDAVVQEAMSPDSVLHGEFEWNDTEAARQHRLNQARGLIRSVRVEFSVDSRVLSTPFYIRDPDVPSDTQGYVQLPRLMNEKDAARRAVIAEFVRAEAAMQRAKDIAAVLGSDETVDALILGVSAYRKSLELGDSAPV